MTEIEYIEKRIELEKQSNPDGFSLTIDCWNYKHRASDLAGYLVVAKGLHAQGIDNILHIECWPKVEDTKPPKTRNPGPGVNR